jgi:hypothetical protein
MNFWERLLLPYPACLDSEYPYELIKEHSATNTFFSLLLTELSMKVKDDSSSLEIPADILLLATSSKYMHLNNKSIHVPDYSKIDSIIQTIKDKYPQLTEVKVNSDIKVYKVI